MTKLTLIYDKEIIIKYNVIGIMQTDVTIKILCNDERPNKPYPDESTEYTYPVNDKLQELKIKYK